MHDSHVVKGVAGIVCAVALAGCSLWLSTDERQCHKDSDCQSANLGDKCVQQVCVDKSEACTSSDCDPTMTSPSEVEPKAACEGDRDCKDSETRCLNKLCIDKSTVDYWKCSASDKAVPPPTVHYGFNVVDFLTRTPPKNVMVKACWNMDISCEQPVATFTDTNNTGNAQFELPNGFTGFFEVHSDAVPTLLYVTQPITKNTKNRDLPAVTADVLDAFTSGLGAPYDTSLGIVLIEAIECSGVPQGNIHFSTKGDGVPFYLVNQVPTKDQKVTVYDPTNNTADGGFINVPLGFASFSAQVGADPDGLQLGTFNTQIRPNTITFIDMHF